MKQRHYKLNHVLRDNKEQWYIHFYNCTLCGSRNRNLRKWIHSSSEYHRLGQEKKDLFSGSDSYCFGPYQTHLCVVYAHLHIVIHTVSTFAYEIKNAYSNGYCLGSEQTFQHLACCMPWCLLFSQDSQFL